MLFAVLFGCTFMLGFSGSLGAEIAAAQTQKALTDVAKGNNLLAFDIYKELAKQPGNICFSPLSAETILALTFQGAKEQTATEMATTLRLPNDPVAVALGFKAATEKLKSSTNGVIFNTANKIYPANTVKVNPAFKQVAVDSFNADVETLDFNKNTEAAQSINQWVEGQTNSKIKDLINPSDLDGLTRMVLVNCLYFLGKWKHTFEVSPYPIKFYETADKFKEVPAMRVENTFGYAENDDMDVQIVELPYKDTDYSMLIILPRKVDGLAKVESKFPLNLQEIIGSLQKITVAVTMPKFKIEQTIQMNDVLKKLGMVNAFDETKANFSGIANEELHISKVIQKTFIEVNEEGTEAAAATAGFAGIPLSLGPRGIVINRPFTYILQRKSLALIIGRGNIF